MCGGGGRVNRTSSERSVWFNQGRFNSFRDTDNNPAVPYLLVFQTKGS